MLIECIRVVALATLVIYSIGYPLEEFYPFGLTAGDSNLPANDDNSTSSIPVSVSFPFFGSSYNSVFVSYFTFVKCKIIDNNDKFKNNGILVQFR